MHYFPIKYKEFRHSQRNGLKSVRLIQPIENKRFMISIMKAFIENCYDVNPGFIPDTPTTPIGNDPKKYNKSQMVEDFLDQLEGWRENRNDVYHSYVLRHNWLVTEYAKTLDMRKLTYQAEDVITNYYIQLKASNRNEARAQAIEDNELFDTSW
jgi:hypothetical protein